ncbi:MAG TPA: glycosyl hydrolase family 79 C-terminal domain-containing protein [Solirubrobacteraceae bacterium]
MQRDRIRACILAAFTASLLVAAVAVLADLDAAPAGAAGIDPTPTGDPAVTASVGSQPAGQAMPQGFTGLSLEYGALHSYTGRDPDHVNPVLINLMRNLVPGNQTTVLRIGGNSADKTWWPIRGQIPPGGINYALNPGWMRTTRALASTLGAKMIMGVNLAGGRPAVAATESRALIAGVGRNSVQAFEIGNEPDVYGMFPWYRARDGRVFFARGHGYNLNQFIKQYSRWRAAMPTMPVTGPAFAELNWLSGLPKFMSAEPGIKLLTLHRYPLRACLTDTNDPGYPTIPNLLADRSSAGLAQQVAPYVRVAHKRRLQFRLDEMNSASCSGKPGVSDTFASALWVLDTLFNLANVGVDGVNVHSLPGAAYELFTFQHTSGGWEAFVHPEYYGMLLFARAFPPGAQLVPVNVNPNGLVKVWATRSKDFSTRVVLINKDPTTSYTVTLQVPGFTSNASLERLQASDVFSTNGVTLGGQSFGDETTTGLLPGLPQTETVAPTLGNYTVTLPPASAALLTQ